MANRNPSPGYKAEKVWRDALRLAANRCDDVDGKKVKRLARIAEATIREALDGNMAAIKEIGDRLDGKPAQAVSVSGDDGGPVKLALIERVIVKATDTDG